MNSKRVAVIAGVGETLGLALCQKFLSEGFLVAGLSRSAKGLPELGDNYLPVSCDITDVNSVNEAITKIETTLGSVSTYIHNAAYLLNRDFLETKETDFSEIWKVCCLGAFNGTQRVLPSMLERKEGTILVSGATASIKAGAKFSAFASAKFALRGLTQSLAREYSPAGIHIAHIVLDGAIWGKQAELQFAKKESECLSPLAIAETYYYLDQQQCSGWTHEVDLRTNNEIF